MTMTWWHSSGDWLWKSFCLFVCFYIYIHFIMTQLLLIISLCFCFFFFPEHKCACLQPSWSPRRVLQDVMLDVHRWHLGHLPKSKCTYYQLLLTLLLLNLRFRLLSVIRLKNVPCGVWLRVRWLKIQAIQTVDLVQNSPDYQRSESFWSLIQTLCGRFVWTKQTKQQDLVTGMNSPGHHCVKCYLMT